MFGNIRKHHLFASFASYSLQNIRTNLHTHIRFDAEQIHVETSIASEQIFASHGLILAKYLLQNIRFETNNHKTLSEFHIQANICLQINAYKGIFTCKYSQCTVLL